MSFAGRKTPSSPPSSPSGPRLGRQPTNGPQEKRVQVVGLCYYLILAQPPFFFNVIRTNHNRHPTTSEKSLITTQGRRKGTRKENQRVMARTPSDCLMLGDLICRRQSRIGFVGDDTPLSCSFGLCTEEDHSHAS